MLRSKDAKQIIEFCEALSFHARAIAGKWDSEWVIHTMDDLVGIMEDIRNDMKKIPTQENEHDKSTTGHGQVHTVVTEQNANLHPDN